MKLRLGPLPSTQIVKMTIAVPRELKESLDRYAAYLNSQPVSHCSKSLCRCSTNASDHRKSRETVSTQFGRATFLENWSAIR
jgi:hypothetical protein